MKTKRIKCWDCGHKRGYSSNVVSEREWMCTCTCHIHEDGHTPSASYMKLRNDREQQEYVARLKALGCVFNG